MQAVLDLGQARKHVAATALNATSSRSHTILTLYLKQQDVGDEEGFTAKASKLHLIDLAGSERVGRSKTSGERLEEGRLINLSLSALGNVINALTSKSTASSSSHSPAADGKQVGGGGSGGGHAAVSTTKTRAERKGRRHSASPMMLPDPKTLQSMLGQETKSGEGGGGESGAEGGRGGGHRALLASITSRGGSAGNLRPSSLAAAHVPYRNSKLTRLLQDSLGGNSQTLMICCLSPASCNRAETLCTIRFAARAKMVQVR